MNRLTDLPILLLRLGTGFMLAYFHGLSKITSAYAYLFAGKEWKFINTVANIGFPIPVFFAISAAITEFVGGILLAVGLLTRIASLFISFTLLVAIYRHLTTDLRFELAGLYFLISLLFLISGGGRYSIDSLIKKR